MEESAVVASRSGRGRFANYTVDGVSCESRHVMRTICEFLSCQINHLGSTDPNHNMKSWRYQIVAGGGTVGRSIGRYVLDADLLRLAGVSMDLWRPNDFASDLLVLKLVSVKTIEKLEEIDDPFGSTSCGDKGVLSLTLFFIRLHLHAVNGLGVPARHRAVYLWCSMIWLTSISGASEITKRNVVSEVIPFFFLVLCSDFAKPRGGTSESAEHHFGLMRSMIREFTTLECAQLLERQSRRLRQMYKNMFRPTCDPQKGYQATYNDFFHYSVDPSPGVMNGTVDIDPSGDYVANQLWPAVQELISYSSGLMRHLMTTLGVTGDELSPFCRDFTSLGDLRDEFIRYMPSTFNYDDVHGTVDTAVDESVDDDVEQPAEVSVADRALQFTQEITELSEQGEDSDGTIGEVGAPGWI